MPIVSLDSLLSGGKPETVSCGTGDYVRSFYLLHSRDGTHLSCLQFRWVSAVRLVLWISRTFDIKPLWSRGFGGRIAVFIYRFGSLFLSRFMAPSLVLGLSQKAWADLSFTQDGRLRVSFDSKKRKFGYYIETEESIKCPDINEAPGVVVLDSIENLRFLRCVVVFLRYRGWMYQTMRERIGLIIIYFALRLFTPNFAMSKPTDLDDDCIFDDYCCISDYHTQ